MDILCSIYTIVRHQYEFVLCRHSYDVAARFRLAFPSVLVMYVAE